MYSSNRTPLTPNYLPLTEDGSLYRSRGWSGDFILLPRTRNPGRRRSPSFLSGWTVPHSVVHIQSLLPRSRVPSPNTDGLFPRTDGHTHTRAHTYIRPLRSLRTRFLRHNKLGLSIPKTASLTSIRSTARIRLLLRSRTATTFVNVLSLNIRKDPSLVVPTTSSSGVNDVPQREPG